MHLLLIFIGLMYLYKTKTEWDESTFVTSVMVVSDSGLPSVVSSCYPWNSLLAS